MQSTDEDDEFFDDVYDAIFDDSWSPEAQETPKIMTIKPGDVVLPKAEISPQQAKAKKKVRRLGKSNA